MGSWTVRTTSAPCSVLFGSARPPGGPSPVDRRNAQVGSLLSPIPIIISVQQCRPSWDVPVVLKWHLKLHSEVGAVPRQVDVYRAGGGSRQGPESREQRTTSGCSLGVCANGVAAAAACLHTALPLACCQVFAEILPPAPDSSPSQKKKRTAEYHGTAGKSAGTSYGLARASTPGPWTASTPCLALRRLVLLSTTVVAASIVLIHQALERPCSPCWNQSN